MWPKVRINRTIRLNSLELNYICLGCLSNFKDKEEFWEAGHIVTHKNGFCFEAALDLEQSNIKRLFDETFY